jgi:tRNA-2-methylthio-N6-dimethylallyladenosine synthase
VAQAEGKEIMRRAPNVDLVLGPQTYHRLPELIAMAERKRDGRGVMDTEFPHEPKFDHLPDPTASGTSAFLSVQEGCDKFCTFCVVPYTRGAEYSRPAKDLLREARILLDKGVSEITLLGQNVNAYHGEAADGSNWGLGRLIHALAELDGLERIRYTTSHPRDVDDALVAAHRDVPQLMPFLHLPVQAGSDKVLKAMNRGHTAATYKAIVDKLKTARPDLALSSDFIVGFPGETDQDFADTMDLVRTVGFIQAYSFKYSPRPGTPAAMMHPQVDEAVKAERLAILQDELVRQQLEFNRACEGKVMPVLFDREGRHDDQLVGRSPYMQPVHVVAPATEKGKVLAVQIKEGKANSLAGELV